MFVLFCLSLLVGLVGVGGECKANGNGHDDAKFESLAHCEDVFSVEVEEVD